MISPRQNAIKKTSPTRDQAANLAAQRAKTWGEMGCIGASQRRQLRERRTRRSPKSQREGLRCLELPRLRPKRPSRRAEVETRGQDGVPQAAAASAATRREGPQVAAKSARGAEVPHIAPPSAQAAFAPRRGRNKGRDGVHRRLAASAAWGGAGFTKPAPPTPKNQ